MKRFFAAILLISLFLCSCGGNTDTVSEVSKEEKPLLDNSLLIVFGDSITALGTWGKTVAENCNMRFFNGAKGGITSAEGLERFETFVASRNPDFVTLCFGMNDLLMVKKDTPKVTPEDFKENMKSLVEKTKNIGAVPILLTTNTLDVNVFYASQGQDKSLYGDRDILKWLDTYNDMTRAVAEETGCHLVDLRAECGKYEISQVVKADGIHLSENGNRIFAEAVSEYMLSNFRTDANAPTVSYDNSKTLLSGEKALLAPLETGMWYMEKGTMTISGGEKLVMKNTNNLWPDAQCSLTEGIKVKVSDATLNVRVSTANVCASIILYLDGAYPHAYSEGQYVIINPFLNCNTDSYTGDITQNQNINVSVPISSLNIPASSIHDGYVTFSGIKIYVAGTARQAVTVEEISVSVK